MNRLYVLLASALAFLAAACVTINVYFPAAAAEAAADRVIDEVWGGQAMPAPRTQVAPPASLAPAAPEAPALTVPQRVFPENPNSRPESSLQLFDALEVLDARARALLLLDFVLPSAHAAEPNIDVSSPEIKRLTDSMESRFKQLSPYLDSGAVGLAADGFMAVREGNAVPLAERNTVRTLIANENADRAALYREIAQANGQPEWEAQIRGVFAQRWITRARPGWYTQDRSGAWAQK